MITPRISNRLEPLLDVRCRYAPCLLLKQSPASRHRKGPLLVGRDSFTTMRQIECPLLSLVRRNNTSPRLSRQLDLACAENKPVSPCHASLTPCSGHAKLTATCWGRTYSIFSSPQDNYLRQCERTTCVSYCREPTSPDSRALGNPAVGVITTRSHLRPFGPQSQQ